MGPITLKKQTIRTHYCMPYYRSSQSLSRGLKQDVWLIRVCHSATCFNILGGDSPSISLSLVTRECCIQPSRSLAVFNTYDTNVIFTPRILFCTRVIIGDHHMYASDRMMNCRSIFLAHASALSTSSALPIFIRYLTSLPTLKRAMHCMHAYRVVEMRFCSARML